MTSELEAKRVAGIDRGQKAAVGIAEIGHGVERNVGHGLAEHDVEHQQVVDRAFRIADRWAKASEDWTAKRAP